MEWNKKDEVGKTYGELLVIGEVPRPDNRKTVGTYYKCRCSCGREPIVLANSLRSGDTKACGHRKGSRKENPSYRSAHARVATRRGKASEHLCVGCGKPARYWAYQHNDLDALVETVDKKNLGMIYSLDVNCYEPMCDPCHATFDLEHGKKNGPKKEKS